MVWIVESDIVLHGATVWEYRSTRGTMMHKRKPIQAWTLPKFILWEQISRSWADTWENGLGLNNLWRLRAILNFCVLWT
jgi:hypothetical protein